jgi:hypothetical protein
MRNILFLLAVACGCTVLGGCDKFQEGFQQGYKENFDENFDKSFRMSCKSSAEKQGALVAAAAQYCDCVMDAINSQNLGMAEKTALAGNPEKLQPLAKQCAASLAPKQPG